MHMMGVKKDKHFRHMGNKTYVPSQVIGKKHEPMNSSVSRSMSSSMDHSTGNGLIETKASEFAPTGLKVPSQLKLKRYSGLEKK